MTPEQLYATRPPWDIARPQPAFLALAAAGDLRGRALDVGCGTGEHVLMAAGLGLAATGIDLARNALHSAELKARQRELTARFLRHDALDLVRLAESFDTVLDCGLFHIFGAEQRIRYAASVRSVLVPGGRYFMLGISDQEPGRWGPHRLGREDITAAFTTGWQLDGLQPATIDVCVDPGSINAWLVTATAI